MLKHNARMKWIGLSLLAAVLVVALSVWGVTVLAGRGAGDIAQTDSRSNPTDRNRGSVDADIYYADIDQNATGEVLKQQLHDLIDDQSPLTYRELWDALAYTDAEVGRAGYVVLFYSGWPRSALLHGGQPSEWNREHIWAKSRGQFGTAPPAGTDLHHIRPTDVSVNQARANLAFDDGGVFYIDADGATHCRLDGDSWEPRDAVKGDVARMIFYMAVRYESAALDMELVEAALPQDDRRPVHGVLSTLLRWHVADPPDTFERRRNDRIFELQGNRNPFIDHPEWAARIWETR